MMSPLLLAVDRGHNKRGVLNAGQNRVKPAGDGKRPEEWFTDLRIISLLLS